MARRLVGDQEASRLVNERPAAVLDNLPPQDFGLTPMEAVRPSVISTWFSRRRASL